MQRVLVLTNLPTPYQIDFWGAMAQHCALKAAFLVTHEANRDWTLTSPEWMVNLQHTGRTTQQKLLTLLEELKPTVIIVGGYKLPYATWLRRYARERNIPFYYWLEQPLPANILHTLARKAWWLATLPFAQGVLAIGSGAVKAYIPYAKKISNLPYAIQASKYAKRERITADPLRILFVGQFIARKGINELLEAFATLSADTAILSLAGSGELKPIVDEALVKNPNIKLLGFLEPDRLAAEFAKHDILVLPSRHDGWGVVIAEAMAAGLPVIGTQYTGAFVDLVKEKDAGRQCEVNAASIREAMQFYIDQPEEVNRQGKNAYTALMQSRAEITHAVRDLVSMLEAA